MSNKRYKRSKLQGIYKIENIKNGKIYIGSTIDLAIRWGTHLTSLVANKHHNYLLQRDFEKYNISDFVFSIIEVTSLDKYDLLKLETEYILKYNSIDEEYGYNLSLPTANKYKSKSINKIDKNDLELIKENMNIVGLSDIKKYQNDEYNDLVKSKNAFSYNWFNNKNNIDLTRNLMSNWCRKTINAKTHEIYWTTYKDFKDNIKNKGYTKGYIDTYIDTPLKDKRNILMFSCNIYKNPQSLSENDELYAFNILMKWIICVCNINQPFIILIPSFRMIDILNKYIGGVTNE